MLKRYVGGQRSLNSKIKEIDQSMSWFDRLKYNAKQSQEDKKIIKCPNCKRLIYSANWHYLTCEYCGYYIWDDRNV